MREVFWIDVDEEQPDVGQWIFYLDKKVSDWYEKNSQYMISAEDIDRGEYITGNLVEWFYDAPSEEFKYWYPVPRGLK